MFIINNSFLFIAERCLLCMAIPHFSGHAAVDEHLVYLQILAIVHKAAMTASVQVFVWLYAFISLW